jgi:AcrR family transcriptional regulator
MPMGDDVKDEGRRTRRARRSEQTRQRIVEAASGLFTERGYHATTIDAIAERADVAVETVYSRFKNKANLLNAILEPAIIGAVDAPDLLDRPEIAEIRTCEDQAMQLLLLARFSRGILERTETAHRVLLSAAASDELAAELQRRDAARRRRIQRAYIDMLLAHGPLRPGLTPEEAAATYGALANPTTYSLLTRDHGWQPDRFEQWLATSLTALLLP